MFGLSLFKRHNRHQLIGFCLLSLCVFGLIFVGADTIQADYRAQWAVELLGVTGALWLFRILSILLLVGLVFGLKSDFRADKKIDRIASQKNLLDKSVRRDP